MRTVVSPPPTPLDLQRLEDELRSVRSLFLSVSPEVREGLGFQYLLFVIPFGKVVIDDPDSWVENALREHAALRGAKLTFAPDAPIKLVIESISLNGLDLFFFRLVRCTLTFRIFDGEQWSESEAVSVTEPVVFAREAELQDAVDQAVLKVAEHPLLSNLWRGRL